jgi:hypothetical protein
MRKIVNDFGFALISKICTRALQQIKELHDDLYDIGFSMADEVGDVVVVEPAWGIN